MEGNVVSITGYVGTGRLCCKRCGTGLLEHQKTGKGGAGYCNSCDAVNVARVVVGLPVFSVSDRPAKCCDAAEVCPCHGWMCKEHGHEEGRFGHD